MKTTIDEIRTALVRSNEGVGRPYPAGLRVQVLVETPDTPVSMGETEIEAPDTPSRRARRRTSASALQRV